MELVIGTKTWSTWSLRPWLVARRSGLPFTETLVKLREFETSEAEIARHSPSNLVPVLKDGELVVWDSLAICEYLAEKAPGLWPKDAARRAVARSVCAEMHSGFSSLRSECPMDLGLRSQPPLSEATAKDVRKIVGRWNGLLGQYGGPFLLGDWSIADAFYTPVATRFRSYGVKLGDHGDTGPAAAYCSLLLEQPEFLEWEKDALAAA
jgi:glutathione S-transferase